MKNNKPTFQQILSQTEKVHSERLMRKARKANRIAKTLRGHRRQLAYGVKHKTLKFLVQNMPEQTSIRKDIILTDFVVVELRNSQSGLHFPTAQI
jgi:hypothetical protein